MSLMLDISGFEALFTVNYQPLCVTSYRIVQDRDIAEDIVQDIFYKLWEKRGVLVIDTSLKSYLFQQAIEQSLEYVKRFRNAFGTESVYTEENLLHNQGNEQAMALKGVSRRVDDAVRSLPEISRMIFILSRFHKLHYEQISSRLEIPVKTVESQLTNALNLLGKFLLH